MNIKKTISTILSLAIAGSISIGLVACDGGNTGDGGDKTVVSEKVTKEEWESAFTATNFVNGAVKWVVTRSGELHVDPTDYYITAHGTATTTTEVVIDGGKQYMKISYSGTGDKAVTDAIAAMETEEQYTSRYDADATNPIYIYYGEKDPHGQEFRDMGDGVHWLVRDGVGGYGEGLFDSKIEELLSYKPFYESFEYNDAKKGYTVKEDAQYSDQFEGMVLKFKDYKIVALEIEKSDSDTTYTELYTITYGNQTVTLPTPAASPYAGTWKTKYIKDDSNNETYEIGDTVEFVFGSSPVVLADDTMQITFTDDGNANYKYLTHSNPCVWDYDGYNQIFMYSNNLPENSTRWYLNYDEDTECITMRLDYQINIYLEKVPA